MSRRSSRYSIDDRENDALFEFENFKKKFLLSNKHITKLNSTLSLRIEELNAQVATLQAENLRLREAELSTSRQLKSEREKSRHIMLNAENAVDALTKHFSTMRAKFDVPYTPAAPSLPKKSSPKAKRPASRGSSDDPPPTGSSPPRDRLAKMPEEPDILEDDEPLEEPTHHSSRKRVAVNSQHTSGNVPHTRAILPSAIPALPISLSSTAFPDLAPLEISTLHSHKKKKPTRRQSGIFSSVTNTPPLTLEPPRPISPSQLHGSSVQHIKATPHPIEDDEDAVILPPPASSKIKEKKKTSTSSEPTSVSTEVPDRGRKISRQPGRKLKDVTNSPHRKPSSSAPRSDENTEPSSYIPPVPSLPVPTSVRAPLTTPAPSSPVPIPRPSHDREEIDDMPLPSTSQLDTPIPAGGRSTRNRKSVNYAEPKLNTKMRKPDSLLEDFVKVNKRAKRASAAAALPSTFSDEVGEILRSEKPRSAHSLPPSALDDDRNSSTKPRSSSSSSSTVKRPPSGSADHAYSPSSLPLPPSPPRRKPSASSSSSRQKPTYSYDLEEDEGDEADEEYVPLSMDRRRRTIGSSSVRMEKTGEEIGSSAW